MSETYAGKPIDKHPSSAPKKEYPDAFSGIGAEYRKAALNFPTELERLRAENARLDRALHDYIKKYQRLLMQYEPEKAAGLASAAMGESDEAVSYAESA